MSDEIRIEKLRTYLFGVVNTLSTDKKYQINANMLDDEAENYSLDKLPTESEVERWITGTEIHRDVFSFRSRRNYSQDAINNLANIGFYEKFEKIISSNNEKGVLPEIKNIESIECLNCGSVVNANTNTAEFDIQIQITYRYN